MDRESRSGDTTEEASSGGERVLAIDIGGTKVAAGLVDSTGQVAHPRQVPTPDSDDPEQVWEAVAGLIDEVAATAPLGVGIGSAGPIDNRAGTVSPVNIAAWRRFPLVERVRELVGEAPVRLAGDGVAAALGEQWRGAARGADDVLVAVVSTGVGGGVISGGRVVTGRGGNAGHVGHVVIDYDGEPCVCGSRGCVEVYASGPNMVRHARSLGWAQPHGDARMLFEAVRAGDPAATAAVERGAAAIAAMVASQGAAFDLGLAVLGGGVLGAADEVLPRVRTHLATYAGLGYLADLEVVPAELGSDAGLVGAARLIHQPEVIADPPSPAARPG